MSQNDTKGNSTVVHVNTFASAKAHLFHVERLETGAQLLLDLRRRQPADGVLKSFAVLVPGVGLCGLQFEASQRAR
jgi:hypothetical protein